MTIFFSGTKGDFNWCRRKQPAIFLLDIINGSVLIFHISKFEHEDIVNSFEDVYHNYWANKKRYLVMVPVINAADLTLIIPSYT